MNRSAIALILVAVSQIVPKHRYRCLWLLLLWVLADVAHAVKVPDLYEAMVPIASQAEELRPAALAKILKAVAIKVSGQQVLPAYFTNLSGSLEHLLERFGYESIQDAGEQQLYFHAQLDPNGVKQLLREQGLPVWPQERPTTLLWLAFEDGQRPGFIVEDGQHDLTQMLKNMADNRGLPVVFPLLDLTERAAVNFMQVATLNSSSLQAVSEKYGAQYLLLGYIRQEVDDLWYGQWQGDQLPLIQLIGSLEEVIAAAIHPMTNRIAKQFASQTFGDAQQYFVIVIDDVQGAFAYAKTLHYLQSLSLVDQVEVIQIEAQKVSFRLHTRSDMAAILRIIEIDQVLYPRETIDELVYGLNPLLP